MLKKTERTLNERSPRCPIFRILDLLYHPAEDDGQQGHDEVDGDRGVYRGPMFLRGHLHQVPHQIPDGGERQHDQDVHHRLHGPGPEDHNERVFLRFVHELVQQFLKLVSVIIFTLVNSVKFQYVLSDRCRWHAFLVSPHRSSRCYSPSRRISSGQRRSSSRLQFR